MASNPEIPGYDEFVPVGHGGYAVVYRARQKAVGRVVAVKVLTQVNFDTATTRRFLEECRLLGSLSWHPNIVVVFDAGVTRDETPYLALEQLGLESYGDGTDGKPNISLLSNEHNKCVYNPSNPTEFPASTIYHQSVPPNTVITWGEDISYWYWGPGQPPPCPFTPANTPEG